MSDVDKTPEEMKAEVTAEFEKKFGPLGDGKVYFAPGRVNLIGEHTDYNGGHVFPCALTIGTYAAARKRSDRKLHFYSVNFPQNGVIETSLDDLVPDDAYGWTNYPKGVIYTFIKESKSPVSKEDIEETLFIYSKTTIEKSLGELCSQNKIRLINFGRYSTYVLSSSSSSIFIF